MGTKILRPTSEETTTYNNTHTCWLDSSLRECETVFDGIGICIKNKQFY